MPRNGSGVFSAPAGTTATPNTKIESAKYNAFVADLTNDLNLARPIVAGGTGATTKTGAQQALDLEPGVDIQAYDAKLAALAALTLAADKLIYATGTNTLATSDLTPFARTLLAAPDLAAIWTLLYLGALAGKNKISVPGDINASGTPDGTTFLRGDGAWRGVFGLAQIWQNKTGTMARDVTYQNTTIRPILVSVTMNGRSGRLLCGETVETLVVVSGTSSGPPSGDGNARYANQIIVPSGWYYRAEGGDIHLWSEFH